jgi:HSP20 family protein
MEHSFGPYLEIARIQSEMNKMFDVLVQMRDEKGQAAGNSWIPSVDVHQNSQGLVVTCELPGVPPETLRVTALGGALIIAGERPPGEPPVKGAKYHVMERINGRFRRVVPLGVPINTRDATAALKGGVLEVFFPKVSNRRGEEVVIPVAVTRSEDRK